MGEVPPVTNGSPLPSLTNASVRFGSFEVDLRAGELRKSGMKIKLQGQPLEVLALLLERSGQVVTREELQQKLWATDTFVDFEHGLNKAISRVREALADEADNPRFIETLPRRGYRFIAPVKGMPRAIGGQSAPVLPAKPMGFGIWHEWWGWTFLALLLLAGGVGLFFSGRRSVPVTSPSEYTQITNFADSAVAPSLSPDGRMVTFKRSESAFASIGQIYVKLLPNGDPVRLTNDSDFKYAPVFAPDGSRVAYTDFSFTGTPIGFNTWTVPVLGGQPTLLLPNASGLTWITDQRILFSEVKTGFHMGIVTAAESRANRREIYFPANDHAMAHYAYASPDGKSILVVEMDQTHAFHQPCRLAPLDGSSAGKQVGPRGTCTSAAWSPDGKWMYFGVMIGHNSHLWRQRFPDGTPEQITFGPSEEEGVAVAPDGRSLVTSVGTRRSAVWIHDGSGERAISSEGYAVAPQLSRDGRRVFYLFAQDLVLAGGTGWINSSGDLRSVDLGSGKTDSVLPGMSVTDYDISRDEKEVAFTTTGGSGEKWCCPLRACADLEAMTAQGLRLALRRARFRRQKRVKVALPPGRSGGACDMAANHCGSARSWLGLWHWSTWDSFSIEQSASAADGGSWARCYVEQARSRYRRQCELWSSNATCCWA